MTKEIRITVTAPEDCTDEEFRLWAEFCLGYRGSLSMEHPLVDYDLEAETVDVD
jgi:hypothetical protein